MFLGIKLPTMQTIKTEVSPSKLVDIHRLTERHNCVGDRGADVCPHDDWNRIVHGYNCNVTKTTNFHIRCIRTAMNGNINPPVA